MNNFEKDINKPGGMDFTKSHCKHLKKSWCAKCLDMLKPNLARKAVAAARIGEGHIDGLIYLASPYTMKSKIPGKARYFKRKRYHDACKATVALIEQGHVVFSPIVHSHPLALSHGLSGDWAFWRRQDIAYLYACSELWVLMLPGWKESIGVKEEIGIAALLGKRVSFLDPLTYLSIGEPVG